jgi:hypothetical protein
MSFISDQVASTAKLALAKDEEARRPTIAPTPVGPSLSTLSMQASQDAENWKKNNMQKYTASSALTSNAQVGTKTLLGS